MTYSSTLISEGIKELDLGTDNNLNHKKVIEKSTENFGTS